MYWALQHAKELMKNSIFKILINKEITNPVLLYLKHKVKIIQITYISETSVSKLLIVTEEINNQSMDITLTYRI